MINPNLAQAIRASWSASTAAAPDQWHPDNPAAGHCDVTALTIRDHVGGGLCMAQVFRNDELSEHHYWNRLPNGRTTDLTREQFTGDEEFGPVTEMDDAFFEAAPPMNQELTERLAIFRATVAEHLEAMS